MKNPLLKKLNESAIGQDVIRVLDKFVMRPDDKLEATAVATKDDVQIIFRIIKGQAAKNFANSKL